MTIIALSEELSDALVRAERELLETLASGEHPAAAEDAIRRAYGRAEWELFTWGGDERTYRRLAGALAATEKAGQCFAINRADAVKKLNDAVLLIQPLAKAARALRDGETNW